MAVLAAAALLDELMGRNRNVLPHEKVKELNWEDSEYCKYFMVKFCPHDLFVNTKADLGTCPKVHDEEVRKIFAKAKGYRKVQYQEEFLRCCSQMVNEVERKIQKGRQRLALIGRQDMSVSNPALFQRNEEQIAMLNERINGLEKETEEAGNNGNVEQAQGLMKLCDQLKDERDLLQKQNDTGHRSATAELAAAQEKQMEICEVCGAFLIVGDAQQRIDDHLMGKQHMGYARLKAAIEEIATAVQAIRDDRKSKSVEKKDKERVKEPEKERNDFRDSSSKERERSHHREHRERSEYRVDKSQSTSDRRDKEKERKDKERRDSNERRIRDRLEREKPQRDRDHDRRYQDDGRDPRHHRHSHRRH